MTWGLSFKQQVTTHSPFERSYAGGAYSGGYAGGGYPRHIGYNGGGGGGISNSGYSQGSWNSGGYYSGSSDVSGMKDYSAALSALTLLGFLYFLNMLQNQLLSSGSQTVVFTVGGGTTGTNTANGTLGRRRRDVVGEEVWTRDFVLNKPGGFQQHVNDVLWVYEEDSEFEMGADNGAGRPESANLYRKTARPHRERKKSPSSSGSTKKWDREKGDDGLLDATTSSPTTLPIREASGGPDKGERGPLEVEDAWQQLAGLLPKRLSESLHKCRELITCTLMQQTGDQLPIHNSLHNTECDTLFRAHSRPDVCTELAATLTNMLGSARVHQHNEPHDLL